MDKQIKNKVLKTELVEWKRLRWLQPPNFKELSKASYDKLKASLINNNFVQPFNVWQDKKDIWILDGHHRQKVLNLIEADGFNIPDKLPASFLDCKNKKEAAKLVIIYSAIYANVQDVGLYEFMSTQGIDFDSIKTEIEIPGIDLEMFENNETIKEEQKEINYFKKTHILLSFPPEKFILIQEKLLYRLT